MQYSASKVVEIDAHHILHDTPDPLSPCRRDHGHRYSIKVYVTSRELHKDMVVDFGDIAKVIKYYDHRSFNNFLPNPTAEAIAKLIYDGLCVVTTDYPNNPKISCIEVKETPTSEISFYPEDSHGR